MMNNDEKFYDQSKKKNETKKIIYNVFNHTILNVLRSVQWHLWFNEFNDESTVAIRKPPFHLSFFFSVDHQTES